MDSQSLSDPAIFNNDVTLVHLHQGANDVCKMFLTKMKLTKGARFEAARRLENMARTSQYSIIILSLYVFTLSVWQVIFQGKIDPSHVQKIDWICIVTSAFIMVFSLLESGRRHDLRSELMLKSAQTISCIYNEIEAKLKCGTLDIADMMILIKRYDDVISVFSDNHSDIDYVIYRIKTHQSIEASGIIILLMPIALLSKSCISYLVRLTPAKKRANNNELGSGDAEDAPRLKTTIYFASVLYYKARLGFEIWKSSLLAAFMPLPVLLFFEFFKKLGSGP